MKLEKGSKQKERGVREIRRARWGRFEVIRDAVPPATLAVRRPREELSSVTVSVLTSSTSAFTWPLRCQPIDPYVADSGPIEATNSAREQRSRTAVHRELQ